MDSKKFFPLLTIVWLITVSAIGIAHGAWPDPFWADLPKLEYIYDSDDIIWFYSTLESLGFPPRYVVTYEKSTGSIEFHPVSTKKIPKDAPIDFHKSKQLPTYLEIEPHQVVFRGIEIAIPALTLAEAERLRDGSAYLQRNRRMHLDKFTLDNALQGSFIEVDGVYYFGMKGGIAEGVGHLGGLAVYHPPEMMFTVLRSRYLVDSAVTGITQMGDELVMSTVYQGEFVTVTGPGLYWENGGEHKVGLVLYNTSTGKWRHIPIDNLDIIIRKMSGIDAQLWMTTNLGISCYQLEADKMRNWCWELDLARK